MSLQVHFSSDRKQNLTQQPSVSVVIEARDGGSPPLSSSATVQVQLIDVNDNALYSHQLEYKATVSEDQLPGATILTLEAVDGDLSQEILVLISQLSVGMLEMLSRLRVAFVS